MNNEIRIKNLGIGDTVTLKWLKGLTRANRRQLDRRLTRHNLELRGTNSDDEWIIERKETQMPQKEKELEKKEEEQKEEKKTPQYYESPFAPSGPKPGRKYYESGQDE